MQLKKKHPWNVLVFPAASEIALEIHRALSSCKEVVLHGANQPGVSIANFHFQRLHELPSIYDKDCLPALQELITQHKIDAIFPAYDDIVVWLAEQADKLDATVLAPSLTICRTCRSKSDTYEALKDVIPTPKLFAADDKKIFPVFVKPDKGQGSQRARRIDSADDLRRAQASENDLIVMEYLSGIEYTVDCFSTKGQGLLFASARRRIETRTGISTLTTTEDFPEATLWAKKISKQLDMHGAWFFQMKADDSGSFRLLEIAPRIAGSMALSRVAGVNFPLLTLYAAAGHRISISHTAMNITMGRSLDTRFIHDLIINALYVDLDDTLVIGDKVNTQLVALIYQCRNKGIPVHLITRHKKDLPTTLDKFRLSHLFDKIIHIADDATPKFKYITEHNAVLIDDSHAERSPSAEKAHITCFDSAAALCLLDYRS